MFKVRVDHDSDVENPMEMDGQWTLYSFGRRHSNYKDPESLGLSLEMDADGIPKIKNIGLRRKLDVGLAFFCSYAEHGLCQWSLLGNGHLDPFDSVRIAGLLVWEHSPKDIGAKTRDDRAKDAASFLEVFTSWCNGETYYFEIEKDGEHYESCGGYIGAKDVFDAVKEALHGEDYSQGIEWEGIGKDIHDYYWK